MVQHRWTAFNGFPLRYFSVGMQRQTRTFSTAKKQMKRKRANREDPAIDAELRTMQDVREGKRTRLSQISLPTDEPPSLATATVTGACLSNYGCDAEIKCLYTQGPECHVQVGEYHAFETYLFEWILDLRSVKWSPDLLTLSFVIYPHPELQQQDPDLKPIRVSVEKASFAYGR